jgi:hypothetical protein
VMTFAVIFIAAFLVTTTRAAQVDARGAGE